MATPAKAKAQTAERYTDEQVTAALTVVLTWFRRAANGVINRASDASTPARLMWRAFSMPVAGMVAAVIEHGWAGDYGTNPQPWDVSPKDLVAKGAKGMGQDDASPLVDREAAGNLSHPQITRAIAQVIGEKVDFTMGEPMADPSNALALLLTPKAKSETAAKLPEEETKRIKAIMQLATDDDMREMFVARLTPEGRAELERREKAAAERAAKKVKADDAEDDAATDQK
ncbi:hypothetical protein SAMN05421874_12857 [Nonomuraea maritima]|uniref:Uncharacterized protein n=1 Tax=Nonomuraea maritima TaxID=683260 RepID=A0A1G9MIV1_9ACTN|nr:hypothetical protein [Nonomuraea maritima]SDL74139.1 hypothetical protein SAMN05421874_12857 [Nonomuraea maritima]